MSPRRLGLLLALAAVLVLAALVAAVLLLRAGSSSVVSSPAAAAQDRPGTVILVPGYSDSTASDVQGLAARVRATGRTAQVQPLPGEGTGDLRVQAEALGASITGALAAGAPSVDLVGYSAGGLVVRTWVHEHPDQARREVRRVVTLGSPHHGTSVAGLAAALLPGSCPTACQQMTPGSELLASLARGDETPAVPSWVSVWTTQDQVVTPPGSARLEGAVNVPLQSVCADAQVTHATLPTDPLPTGIVLRAIAVAPLTSAPTAEQCASLRQAGAAAP